MSLNNHYSPVITKINYDSLTLNSIKSQKLNENDQSLILDYPTVYIINDKDSKQKSKYIVYIGETNDIGRRTKQHLYDDIRNGREDFIELSDSATAEMFIIGHKYFNKSLTLDIENKLLHYLSSVEAVVKVNNRKENPQNNYYTSETMETIFSKVWRKLHRTNPELFPTESIIRDSALFKASPFHKLTDEQIEAKNEIILKTISILSQNLEGQLLLVEGEAGSGKTVLMSNLLYDLFSDESLPIKSNELSIHLLVNHEQQLVVYEQLAKKLGLKNKNQMPVVAKPTSFINKQSKRNQKADIVIIDEAHLLLTRGKQSYRGKNHLKDILENAKVVIAVFDEKQILTAEQIWESQDLAEIRLDARDTIKLKNQMRINANISTITWIRQFIDDGQIKPYIPDNTYDLKVFDSPTEMYAEIKKKSLNQDNGISRLLATYDWTFKNSKSEEGYYYVEIGDFKLPWNLQLPKTRKVKDLSWAEQAQTIDEVGSTYTIQGFDLNYAAVIIGPSVKYRNGQVIFDPSESKNAKAIERRTLSDGRKQSFGETLLQNELNVLLTRGVNGLYLFAVDEELQKALKLNIPLSIKY
ncbi:DUF2075 domain-containing protein [Streptococcus parauberis]|uniref:GIY-YIG catalytic domain protein n=1 Tax=Streptococcus parauberis NCFD 2020 TaxID=873447 RepID=F1YZ59_9STRE|nr:DUF2075 domain-containing protein [Streptococcus parauberis]EGE55139.1 GIY-YIG catalytic domain protein [Streptococcus parauberis NCFD 2020]